MRTKQKQRRKNETFNITQKSLIYLVYSFSHPLVFKRKTLRFRAKKNCLSLLIMVDVYRGHVKYSIRFFMRFQPRVFNSFRFLPFFSIKFSTFCKHVMPYICEMLLLMSSIHILIDFCVILNSNTQILPKICAFNNISPFFSYIFIYFLLLCLFDIKAFFH